MHPAFAVILIVVLFTVWCSYAAFRLRYRNKSRRGYRTFRPKWSSGRRHRFKSRFRRRVT
jgi:hypothetical protein